MVAISSWRVWGMEASVAVVDPRGLPEAESIVRGVTADIDAACSRFRPDSELMRIRPGLAAGVKVGPTLALLLRSALAAARWTGGDVDPTLGRDLESLGYDRDFAELGSSGSRAGNPRVRALRTPPGWHRVRLDNGSLTVPEDLLLDLGATAKAVAADLAAARVAERTGTSVLVALGGDIATSGAGPGGGWQVLVQDLPSDPAQQVTLAPGQAMATSSTQKRRWQRGGHDVHHILDPRSGLPAEDVWRSVTVAAPSCLEANAYSTAGVVRGSAAPRWFAHNNITGRFIDRAGRAVATCGWPADRRTTAGAHHGG